MTHRPIKPGQRGLLAWLGFALALLLSLRGALAEQPVASAAAAVAAPGAAPGDEPPPAGEPEASNAIAAAELVSRSVALFNQERYSDAADAMLEAYALRQNPLYLFNAAQAYRRGGRPRQALTHYRRFLAVAPTAPQASEATGHARTREALIAAEDRAAAEGRRGALLSDRVAKSAADLQRARSRTQEERARGRRRAALIGGVTGAVVLGLAITLPLVLTREPGTDWGFHMVTF